MLLPRFTGIKNLHKFTAYSTASLFLLTLLLTTYYLLLTPTARAQIPAPAPIPCDAERYPEFQTLRPYQASPCDPDYEDLALFCGNDLILTDTITRRRSEAFQCYSLGNNQEECIFEVDRNLDLAIDVSGAELPIMGRTEDDVINSQNQNETRDDAQKVNEYVSWYLNGVNPAAEYGALDPESPEDISKLIDYSGPIKKLLPERVKRDDIRQTIVNADKANDIRHNQVVGCVNALGQIAECYPQKPLVRPVRLSDWRKRLPPLEEDYSDYGDFLAAYKEWRGEKCITIFGISLCIDSPLRPNYWGNLFYQIPLSSTDVKTSTEDRKGQIEVVNPFVQPVQPDVTISNVSIRTSPADLFFAHMEESLGLADILQGTYVPKDNPRSGPVVGVSPGEFCDLTEIRTNPGDDLFAGEIGVKVSYTATFSCIFDVDEPPPIPSAFLCNLLGGECIPAGSNFQCDRYIGRPRTRLGCPAAGNHWCGIGCEYIPENPSCTRSARVVLNTVTKTPLVDDIWSRLVAGASGVFKRIFPKVAPGTPVEGILDIPAATGVNYSLVGAPPGVSLTAGNPGLRRGQAAELYFPHIGGIQQYFLQCIQTALRPQGFGELCPSGAPAETASSTCPSVSDSSIPGEWLGPFKQNYINLVNRWDNSCRGSENNLADECYNYVVKRSLDEGVNPAFSLTIWANETAASNYCSSGPTAQDFGINDPTLYQNIVGQLERFLVLPYSGDYTYCRNQPGWIEPMHAFLSRFKSGGCDPTDVCGTAYTYGGVCNGKPLAGIQSFTWPLVTGNCVNGNLFSINWPTDYSCP